MSHNFFITKFRSLNNKEIYNWDANKHVYISEQSMGVDAIESFYSRGINILSIEKDGKVYNFQELKLFYDGIEVTFLNVISLKNKTIIVTAEGTKIPIENIEFLERVVEKNKLKVLEKGIKEKCPREIRIGNFFRKETKNLSIEQFIRTFLADWNNKKNTIFVDSKQEYTPIKKRRSLADLFMITKYYYPKVDLKEFLTILYTKILETQGFRTSYCGQTQKRMYYYSPSESNGILNETTLDEFGFFTEDYNDIIDNE